MSTTVVNIKATYCDEYIGRHNRRYALRDHPLRNRFKIGRDGDRTEVIAKYEAWLKAQYRDDPRYYDGMFDSLRGKRLGCWCKPEACHGDVLARVADMSSEQRHQWAEGEE